MNGTNYTPTHDALVQAALHQWMIADGTGDPAQRVRCLLGAAEYYWRAAPLAPSEGAADRALRLSWIASEFAAGNVSELLKADG